MYFGIPGYHQDLQNFSSIFFFFVGGGGGETCDARQEFKGRTVDKGDAKSDPWAET